MIYTPTILTIAGSDNYGGAGLEIDRKSIHALGGYALSATTALTAQNSTGVKSTLATPTEYLSSQLEAILEDIEIDAVKIGMLANADIIEVVSKAIDKYSLKNIVLDTVLVSSSGRYLLEPSAVDTMISMLFPRVNLITPNIPELDHLLGIEYDSSNPNTEIVYKALESWGTDAILIKGGHSGDTNLATDYLLESNGTIESFSANRVDTTHTHGTGCLLSSAIATNLAIGYPLNKSISLAKIFLTNKLIDSSSLKLRYKEPKSGRREPIF